MATKKDTKKTTKKPAVKKAVVKKVVKKKAPAKKKKNEIVISSPVVENTQIVIASELADDQMIEEEMLGAVAPYFIYEFEQKGQPIVGLTVKGVNEVVRRLNRDARSGLKIRLHPEHMAIDRDVEYDGQKGVEVRVFAENIIDGNSAWGVKFEPYKKQGSRGWYTNTFAVEKATSKAERNAKRKLIPEVLATKTIQAIAEADPTTVKQLDAPKDMPQIVEPKKPTPSEKKDVEKIAMNMVEKCEDPVVLGNIKDRVNSSTVYDQPFKLMVSKVIDSKIKKL